MGTKIKLERMLGLAYKANSLTVGAELSIEKIRRKQVFLVILATDAAENSKRKVIDCCSVNGIKYYEVPLTKAELAHCIGRKSEVGVLTLTNRNFDDIISTLCSDDS